RMEPMRPSSFRQRFAALVGPIAMLCIATSSAFAQGTITGRVTAKESGQPLAESRIEVVGTSLVTLSDADGKYSVRNVPTGAWTVRVLRVGHQEQKKSVTMTNGQN